MEFNIKMENFRQTARLVAGDYRAIASVTITCANIVSKETVRIALMITALNDLEFKLGDTLNVYIQSPAREKMWVTLGPEFHKDAGKTTVIVRALYGLN